MGIRIWIAEKSQNARALNGDRVDRSLMYNTKNEREALRKKVHGRQKMTMEKSEKEWNGAKQV